MEIAAMIQMDQEQAREQLRQYRRELHRRADGEYRAVEQGLSALASGGAVLQLAASIQAAGLGPEGFPRLAVARADRKRIQARWNGRFIDFDSRANAWSWNQAHMDTGLVQRFELERAADAPQHGSRWALIPMVPPSGLEKVGGFPALRRHFILWEVERWYERLPSAKADIDPYLLRHLGGDLYAVVHEWELTDLERAVMTARRS